MSMVPYEVSFCDYLKELVEEGEVSMERIDDAVARVLRLKYRLGLFDNPYWDIKSTTSSVLRNLRPLPSGCRGIGSVIEE